MCISVRVKPTLCLLTNCVHSIIVYRTRIKALCVCVCVCVCVCAFVLFVCVFVCVCRVCVFVETVGAYVCQ